MTKSILKAYRPELSVLVVEDHMLFGKGIKHALPQHAVHFARTIEDAKARYNECLPDIIFLDIDLPDGSGFELLDYVRTREPEAYIIMLTGSKLQEDVALSHEKGAQGYVIKPFTHTKIEQIIEEYLAYREQSIKSLLAETAKHRHEALAATVDAATKG